MLENVKERIKEVIKNAAEQDKQALYDKSVEILGKDVVGEFEEYQCLKRQDGYWTLERCIESAEQFGIRSEWNRGERGAYGAADRNGWLDICLPLTNDRKPRGYWTLDRCLESASEFDTSKKWREHASTAYTTALRNGWIDICWPRNDDEKEKKPPGYWTLDRCIESAKQFKIRKEWSKGEAGAYDAADRKGWLDICLPLSDEVHNGRRPNGYWSFERCIASAKQFNTKPEWHKGAGGAYMAAQKNGWLIKCCAHMSVNKGNK